MPVFALASYDNSEYIIMGTNVEAIEKYHFRVSSFYGGPNSICLADEKELAEKAGIDRQTLDRYKADFHERFDLLKSKHPKLAALAMAFERRCKR